MEGFANGIVMKHNGKQQRNAQALEHLLRHTFEHRGTFVVVEPHEEEAHGHQEHEQPCFASVEGEQSHHHQRHGAVEHMT